MKYYIYKGIVKQALPAIRKANNDTWKSKRRLFFLYSVFKAFLVLSTNLTTVPGDYVWNILCIVIKLVSRNKF